MVFDWMISLMLHIQKGSTYARFFLRYDNPCFLSNNGATKALPFLKSLAELIFLYKIKSEYFFKRWMR